MSGSFFTLELPFTIFIKWTVLLLIFLGLGFWLLLENANTKQLLCDKNTPPASLIHRLLYQSRIRSILLLTLLFLYVVTIGVYDYKLHSLNETKSSSRKEVPLFAQQKYIPEDKEPAPPVPPTVTESIFDPSSATEEADKEYTNTLDELKSRYEELLVTYFYLQQCKQAEATSYSLILQEMDKEMQALETTPQLQENIISAARGSYQEVYSGSSCDPATITPVKAGFDAYITSITLMNNNKTK